MTTDINIQIRAVNPDDWPFIINSWLKSFKESSDFAKNIPTDTFFEMHHKIIESILGRTSTCAFVATPTDDPELILGYAVFEKPQNYGAIAHYTYVKRSFNGFGISEKLFLASPWRLTYATHMTHKGKKIVDKLKLIYCPYLMG
jgi:hypothetical protein